MTAANQKESLKFPPRFKILMKLGEGGVAAVYKVLDRKSDSVRALKVLKFELVQDDQAVKRFQDEFRILRNLHHPGLPEMYDFGIKDNGTPYMVMEYIEGEPLDDYCEENPDDLRLLLYEISEALSFIHAHNLLHLDIKPDNILVRKTTAYGRSEKPEAVLIDFGMSYRRDAAGEVTVSGTPAYMPPEIIRKEEHLTRAADYYSLGVTIYELMEGRVPFEGSLEEVLRAHLSKSVTFERETVEYADLYQPVRDLMSKDTTPRLEVFEALRRELATRESGEVAPLERAYGMGYIDSLGIIGKQDIWDDLTKWVSTTTHQLDERRGERAHSDKILDLKAEKRRKEPHSLTNSLDLLKDLKDKKHAGEDVARSSKKIKGPIQDSPRTIFITGAEGSGKSYLANAFRGECLLQGMKVWVMGEDSDYEQLVSEDIYAEMGKQGTMTSSVDPKALIIDRYVRGWERLQEGGKINGAVLIMDGYQRATDEEREFLEYISKRLKIVLNEGNEPGVFLFVVGRSPGLPRKMKLILPKGEKAKHHIVPSPSGKDIDVILNSFHGQMASTNDRKQLGEYLKQNQGSSGSVIEAMKHAAVQNRLIRERGRWRFAWISKTRKRDHKKESLSYYGALLQELAADERKIVSWLSCHRGALQKPALLELLGIAESSLEASLERIKPYRLVDVTNVGGEEHLSIVSRAAADGLYENIAPLDAKRINESYIAFYTQRLGELFKLKGKKRARKKVRTLDFPGYAQICESLAVHYGRSKEFRLSLLMRVRAIRALKDLKDLFGLRRLCEEGIRTTRSLRGKYWKQRKWHIERYFIKEWVEAEALANNIYSITVLVNDNIIKRKRKVIDLPLGSFYHYGMALLWLSAYKQCSRLVELQKQSRYSHSPQYIAITLLIKASLLNNISKYKQSLVILKKSIRFKNYLGNKIFCRICLFNALNYFYLGDKINCTKYLTIVKQLAKRCGFYNELLFVYCLEIEALFNLTKYSDAKLILRQAISLASRKKVYYRLFNIYHLLSGIYYEEGEYSKAIQTVNKSAALSANLGIIKWPIDCKLHISFSLENMGFMGAAIAFSEEARSASLRNSFFALYYKSSINLMNLYSKINSNKAKHYKDICNKIDKRIQNKGTIALHKYAQGIYFIAFRDKKRAILEFKKAKSIYSDIELKDDSVRCAIKMIYVYIDMDYCDKASKIIRETKLKLKNIESKDIIADFWTSTLKYSYMTRKRKKTLITILNKCEKRINKIKDIDVKLRMSKMLFRVYSRLGEATKALKYFKLYQSKLKIIVNNLENDYSIDSFLKANNYKELLKEARVVKRKNLKKRLE